MKRASAHHISTQYIAHLTISPWLLGASITLHDHNQPAEPVIYDPSKQIRDPSEWVSTGKTFKPVWKLLYEVPHLVFRPGMSNHVLVFRLMSNWVSNLRIQELVPFRAYCRHYNVVPTCPSEHHL